MESVCKVCYRVGSASTEIYLREEGLGCRGCQGTTRKFCENCDSSIDTPPCAHCYPGRNFRWAALKMFNTGSVPSRFGRYEFCEDCMTFLCDCGVSDYEEAIFEYLERKVPGWVRPTRIATEDEEGESPFDLRAWSLQQIEDLEWRASYDGPHPVFVLLPHQMVIKGVSFCKQCWRPQCSTASGCYCTGLTACSCPSEQESKKDTDTDTGPCPTCWPDGALRHQVAMDFMKSP